MIFRSASLMAPFFLVLLSGTPKFLQSGPPPGAPVGMAQPSPDRWISTSSTRSSKGVAVYKSSSASVVLVLTNDSVGSGSLIDASGLILTNRHVVGVATDVVVVFKPAKEGAEPVKSDARVGRVVKVDEVADLALIKVSDVPPGHPVLPLGDESSLVIGSDVHAIGHPTGEAWTYTTGVISQLRSRYEWSYGKDPVAHSADVIQTQTPISPGNSGGPLLNDAGALVGVNSFGAGEAQNLNFAVSLKDIRAFILRPGDRRGSASPTNAAPPAPRDPSSVRISEVTAPYAIASPQTRRLVLSNSSAQAVEEVAVGALETAANSAKCPADPSAFKAIRLLRAPVPPKASLAVTGDFTAKSSFFCVLSVR